MQNGSACVAGLRRPSARNSSRESPRLRAVVAEVAVHQRPAGSVVAGRHRRVRGEDQPGRGQLARLGERQTPCASISRRMRSSARNAEWPSFMWQTVGLDPQRFQRPEAADAEHDLLPDAHLASPP